MRWIEKGNEPASLRIHRNTPHHSYANYADKDTLREHLLRDQYYLCAYCMRRIQSPIEEKMKIEHFKPQHKYNGEENYPNLTLDYQNLLGVCRGNDHIKGIEKHCDSKKAEKEIAINPLNSEMMRTIRFYASGEIKSINSDYDKEINKILDLNNTNLKRERKAVWEAISQFLHKKGTKAVVQQKIKEYNTPKDGKLEAYCQVAIYHLEKSLLRFS